MELATIVASVAAVLCVFIAAIAAEVCVTRWVGSLRQKEQDALCARLDGFDLTLSTLLESIEVLRADDTDLVTMFSGLPDPSKQVQANLDSIEAMSQVIKRMSSDHQAMNALGQTPLQTRRGVRGPG